MKMLADENLFEPIIGYLRTTGNEMNTVGYGIHSKIVAQHDRISPLPDYGRSELQR